MLKEKMMEYFDNRREELLIEFDSFKEAYNISGYKDYYYDMNRIQARIFELDRAKKYFDNLMNQE